MVNAYEVETDLVDIDVVDGLVCVVREVEVVCAFGNIASVQDFNIFGEGKFKKYCLKLYRHRK
jgi:hypothetical protein